MDKFLVIGLGSMGKRRIRCLRALGYNEIYGFDVRSDRQEESGKNNATIISDVEAFLKGEKPICVISVPPDMHHQYMELCLKYGCHFFVEASVIIEGMDDFTERLNKSSIVGLPSCTLLFHPAIKLIKNIIKDKTYGHVSNFIYHSGQYLPDWHPYEKISDFYVSQKSTGGCREIVPFEMTWICSVLGFPKLVKAIYSKTIDLDGASEIDDTYNVIAKFSDRTLMSLVVDVVSRVATRKLVINLSEAQLRWDWENDYLEVFKNGEVQKISFKKSESHSGYNKNIGEGMYIEEVQAFLQKVSGQQGYPTDMSYDLNILKVLHKLEAEA